MTEGLSAEVRQFTNERGNQITITVTRTVPDTDLVCSVCRWRAGHDPSCKHSGEPWPTFLLSDDRVLIRIEGPASTSENYLTPLEVGELRAALDELAARAEGPAPPGGGVEEAPCAFVHHNPTHLVMRCPYCEATIPPTPGVPVGDGLGVAPTHDRLLITLRRIAYGGAGPNGVFLSAPQARAVALEAITNPDGSHLAALTKGADHG